VSLADDITSQAESVRLERPSHPKGWEPGIEWDGKVGRITAPTDNRVPDWRSLLEMWDFDPNQYEVVEPVQVRTWDAAVGNGEVRRMWYHRAQVRRRVAGGPDVDELVREIRRRKPARRLERLTGETAYVLSANDWQLG
jgi:hypothetical protein